MVNLNMASNGYVKATVPCTCHEGCTKRRSPQKPIVHGYYLYRFHGCTCDVCTPGQRERPKKYRNVERVLCACNPRCNKMIVVGAKIPEHGTWGRYSAQKGRGHYGHNCRCDICLEFGNQYFRERRLRLENNQRIREGLEPLPGLPDGETVQQIPCDCHEGCTHRRQRDRPSIHGRGRKGAPSNGLAHGCPCEQCTEAREELNERRQPCGCNPNCTTMRTMSPLVHGTRRAYGGQHMCRCDECRAENRRTQQKRKNAILAKWIEGRGDEMDIPHGTESGYQNWYCRCDPCKAAGARMNREALERHAGYTINNQHLLDVEPSPRVFPRTTFPNEREVDVRRFRPVAE